MSTVASPSVVVIGNQIDFLFEVRFSGINGGELEQCLVEYNIFSHETGGTKLSDGGSEGEAAPTNRHSADECSGEEGEEKSTEERSNGSFHRRRRDR